MTVHTTPRLDHEQVLDTFLISLDAAATSRQRQLDDLPSSHDDPVAALPASSIAERPAVMCFVFGSD